MSEISPIEQGFGSFEGLEIASQNTINAIVRTIDGRAVAGNPLILHLNHTEFQEDPVLEFIQVYRWADSQTRKRYDVFVHSGRYFDPILQYDEQFYEDDPFYTKIEIVDLGLTVEEQNNEDGKKLDIEITFSNPSPESLEDDNTQEVWEFMPDRFVSEREATSIFIIFAQAKLRGGLTADEFGLTEDNVYHGFRTSE